MSVDELIQLMRTIKLDQVRAAFAKLQEEQPLVYRMLCHFFQHIKDGK